MVGDTIWIVKQESMVDGEIFFYVVPCATLETAKEILKGQVETVLTEYCHFLNRNIEEFEVEEEEDGTSWYINDPSDSYYVDIRIESGEIH